VFTVAVMKLNYLHYFLLLPSLSPLHFSLPFLLFTSLFPFSSSLLSSLPPLHFSLPFLLLTPHFPGSLTFLEDNYDWMSSEAEKNWQVPHVASTPDRYENISSLHQLPLYFADIPISHFLVLCCVVLCVRRVTTGWQLKGSWLS
jgi:hypothetical protein